MSAHNNHIFSPFPSNREMGMSLVSMLIGVAIGSLALMGSYKVYENFQISSWHQDTKADALENREFVARLIKKEFPNAIPNYSATDAVTNGAVWNCPAGGPCVLTNGSSLTLTVRCVPNANTALRGYRFASAVGYPPAGGNCASCGLGTRPVLTVDFTTPGGTLKTWELPDQKKIKTKGLAGMGLCFSTTNSNTPASPTYDTWTITLAPMVLTRYPSAGVPHDGTDAVTAFPDDIHVSAVNQVGAIRMGN